MHQERADAKGTDDISLVIISKDEAFLDDTLRLLEGTTIDDRPVEIVVVDASRGRLDWIRTSHPSVRWIDFVPPPGVRISIPHQRNRGVTEARGSIVVFTDSGCRPVNGWLAQLTRPILEGDETIVVGPVVQPDSPPPKSPPSGSRLEAQYVDECPTINLAFRKTLFERLGGFDEHFEYGSDLDFSWRVADDGTRIRLVPAAVVEVDWGGRKRQLKRSYVYGIARMRLHRKHRSGRPSLIRTDVFFLSRVAIALTLPLALVWPPYLLIAAVPLWRNRGATNPPLAALNDTVMAFGYASELTGVEDRRRRRRLTRRPT